MTIKEVLLGKIEELNVVKNSLLQVGIFLNPDNDVFVYHTMSIGDINGTVGSTPNNLSTILGTVVKAVNKYVDHIKSIPNKESNVIMRDRGSQQYAILSKDGLIQGKVTWAELNSNASFESVQQFLPMSSYKGFVKMMKIDCFPSFRKGGESGLDILFDVVLLRINSRLNILEEYKTNSGFVSIIFDTEHLYGDDVFILGFRPKQQTIQSSVYYSNLSYTIDIEGEDGSNSTETRTINNTPIGNILLDVDTSIDSGILMWDMFTINDFTIEIMDTLDNIETIMPNMYSGSLITGNIITDIRVNGISANIETFKVSCRNSTFTTSVMIDDSYILYDKRENNIERIVFKNVIPIDIVLAEAINAL